MKKTLVEVCFGGLVILGVFLMSLKFTDADLTDEARINSNVMSASTLALSIQNPANNQAMAGLFNRGQLIPGGMDVAAVRIRNTGRMTTRYYLKGNMNGGDETVCQALEMKLLSGETIVKKGRLMETEFDSGVMNNGAKEDLVLLLMLPDNKDLSGKSCSFDIEVSTTKGSLGEMGGFFDHHKFQNVISS